MSGWDDMEADASTTDAAADGFLAQLQAEQVEEGFASTTFGAFEDNDDELALDDMSSESEMSDDELLDTEDEDLDDNEVRKRLNIFQRITNRYSKPRYLKTYFIFSIVFQLTLFTALFSLQGVLGNMNSSIVLVLIAGLLLAAQAAQANAHFNYTVLAQSILDEEKNAVVATAESAANLINRRNRLLKWHGNMIFIPGLVAVFSTVIFLIGIFTVLFHYGITTLDDGTQVCASGPMSVWKAMSGKGWMFAIWHITTYIPVLGVMAMLSRTHFRAYNDACDRTIERESNEVAKGLRKADDSDDDDGPKVALPEDSPLTSGEYLRELFGASTFAQMVTYLVLFWSRDLEKPDQGETCVDYGWMSPDPNLAGVNQTCHSVRRACYSEGPDGDPTTTQLMLQRCCATCSDGPIENGGGVMYVILVVGMMFWGYQCGELRTYLKRGKDPLDTAGTFSDHEVTLRFMWHSGSIFYGIMKCIAGTVIYSMVCLSLMYYFVVHDGTCPSSPIQAIWELTFKGWAVWLVVTLCYGPVIACELILAYNHFFLYQKFHTKRAKLEVKNMGRKAAVTMAHQMMRGLVGGGIGSGRSSPRYLGRESISPRNSGVDDRRTEAVTDERREINPLAQSRTETVAYSSSVLPGPPILPHRQQDQASPLPSPPPPLAPTPTQADFSIPSAPSILSDLPHNPPMVASADDGLDDLAELDAMADPSGGDGLDDLADLDALGMGGDMM